MKLFSIFKWVVVLSIMLSALHILTQAINFTLSKPEEESEIIINQLQPLSELTLPNKFGLVYIKPDTAFMDPLIRMAAQFALAPNILVLNTDTDTILVYAHQSIKIRKQFQSIWISRDKRWKLMVKKYDTSK